MKENKITKESFLAIITLVYVVLLIMSNVMATRLISIGPFVLDAGTLSYPMLFMIGDLLSDSYGYKASRKVIITGFLMNFMFVCISWIGTLFPRLSDDALTVGYDALFSYNIRIVAASFICYLAGSLLNAASLVWIKKWTGEKWFAVRTIGSTILGALVDTVLFSFLAWYGSVPLPDIFAMIVTSYIIKIIYESFIATPSAWVLRGVLRKRVGI